MTKPCTLIVARYLEDVGWTRLVKKPWRVEIIQKGRDLPNEGREASTFLWAIQEHYYQDDGWLAFAQGNPLPHCAVWNVLRPVSTFTWMGDPRYLSEEDGGPWHPGLPVREFCEQHIGEWPGAVKFAAGGQFIIPAHLLRIHPKEKYAELQQLMADGDGPWVMERLWQRLFQESEAIKSKKMTTQEVPNSVSSYSKRAKKYTPKASAAPAVHDSGHGKPNFPE